MQNMFDRLGFTVLRMRFKQIRHMQKAGSLKSDIYKSALHAWQDPHNPPEENITYKPLCILSLD